MNKYKSPQLTVLHNQTDQEFRIELSDSPPAYVRYRLDPSTNSVDFVTTFVPTTHRGQGIAEQLVDAALAWAEYSNLDIKTSCSYVQTKYQRQRK